MTVGNMFNKSFLGRKYYWCTRTKGYKIKEAFSLKYPVAATRPTKNAAGMAYTRARSGHGMKGFMAKTLGNFTYKEKHRAEVNTLSLRGTLDTLRGKGYLTIRVPCGSCGCSCKGKLRLKKNA